MSVFLRDQPRSKLKGLGVRTINSLPPLHTLTGYRAYEQQPTLSDQTGPKRMHKSSTLFAPSGIDMTRFWGLAVTKCPGELPRRGVKYTRVGKCAIFDGNPRVSRKRYKI